MKVVLKDGKKSEAVFSVGFYYTTGKQKLFIKGTKSLVSCKKITCRIQKFVGFEKKDGWKVVTIGCAVCSPRDNFDVRTGRKIAFERAVNLFVNSSIAAPAIVAGATGAISAEDFKYRQRIVKSIFWDKFLDNVKLPKRLKQK